MPPICLPNIQHLEGKISSAPIAPQVYFTPMFIPPRHSPQNLNPRTVSQKVPLQGHHSPELEVTRCSQYQQQRTTPVCLTFPPFSCASKSQEFPTRTPINCTPNHGNERGCLGRWSGGGSPCSEPHKPKSC